MSLLPIFFNNDLYSSRPSRILNQHFGMDLDVDDLLSPFNAQVMRLPTGYLRPWCSAASDRDHGSTIVSDKDKFQINLDVQQFKPEEISVKVSGKNKITVEAKHEEKPDEHGMVYRHFVRTYRLPEGHDINGVVSNLSSDGVLSVSAPRVGEIEGTNKAIPITQTGQPSKPIEKKEKKQANQIKG